MAISKNTAGRKCNGLILRYMQCTLQLPKVHTFIGISRFGMGDNNMHGLRARWPPHNGYDNFVSPLLTFSKQESYWFCNHSKAQSSN